MFNDALLDHVVDIVTAHVSNNAVAPTDLAGLIQAVHGALAGLGQEEGEVEEERVPAVSIRSSVKPDAMTCLECGAKMKLLKRHLETAHRLTPAEYRARWQLAETYPMAAPEYAERRKTLALETGLGRRGRGKGKTKETVETPTAAPRPRKKLGIAVG
ncbi:MAG: MucR family transcriptional regulator [Sphingomonadales bacterium]|nr:MucR family transcriptional regulator [Sphingomonadales bacterium]